MQTGLIRYYSICLIVILLVGYFIYWFRIFHKNNVKKYYYQPYSLK